MEPRAALAHDDGAGLHDRAVVDLDPEALRRRIPAVPGGASTLGLGHLVFPLFLCCPLRPGDAGDLDGGVLLPVAPTAPGPGLGLVGEPGDLGTLALAHDPSGHGD